MKNILITGTTGMVGGHVLDLCIESKEVSKITSLGRRKCGKVSEKLADHDGIDFMSLPDDPLLYKDIDTVFFCLGVYTGAVPRDMFRKINIDFPVNLALKIKEYSPKARFCLLSGQGADRKEKSRIAFAIDKGIAENRLSDLGLGAFHAFRPSYIYPVVPRKEPNFTYRLSRALYPLLKLGGKNMSIKSTELAQGMFNVGMRGSEQEVFENADILTQV